MSDDLRMAEVRRRLLRPESVEDIHGTLSELDDLAASSVSAKAQGDVEDGLRRAFARLRELTSADPEQAVRILNDDLLPRCLRPDRDGDSNFGHKHCYTFGEWLDELPEEHRHRVRKATLPQALAALGGDGVRNAIRLISSIGYWDNGVLAALDRLACERDDETGDHARSARVSLRSALESPDLKLVYLWKLHTRIAAGPNLHQLICCRIIGTVKTAELVWSHWLAPPAIQSSDASLYATLARTLLTEIAARVRDAGLTKRVWDWLVELSRRSTKGLDDVFSSNSSLVNRLDLSDVIPELMRLAVRAEARHRYLYYLRVLECERPTHMAGWDEFPVAELGAVREDAVGPTGMTGRFSTIELHQKEAAWDVLLCRGERSALPSFEDALAGENGYVAHRFLELAACLRLDPLPHTVGALLAGSLENESERLVAQIGAIEAAHGACTSGAFDALLGYRQIGDGVLLSVIAAIAETAYVLAKNGDRSPVEQLLLTAETSPREDSRGAAAGAVAELLEAGGLTTLETVRAAGLLTLQTTDRYARRELLFAFATLPPEEVPFEAVAHARDLLDLLPTDRLDARPAALALIARRQGSRSDADFLTRHLGLAAHGEVLTVGPRGLSGTAPHTVGRYFSTEPERFAPAVVSLLQDGDANAIANLIPSLREARGRIPRVVLDALVARIQKADSGRVAEVPLLHTLADVAPDRLVTEGCQNVVRWLPQARADLADTLVRLVELPEVIASARFELLARLAGDGIYAVRRAAYRAAAACAPDRLINLALSWARWHEPGREGPRRYAAECAGWLPIAAEEESFAHLAWDQEPGVREAHQRSLAEREERQTAGQFEARVLEVYDPDGVIRNWRHGIGLAHVGDDSTIQRLAARLGDELPPAVRFWLKRVRKAVERRWSDVTRKWPEPWYARPGQLEKFTGVIRGEDSKESELAGTLWLMPAESPGELGSWGGWATSAKPWMGDAELMIPGRRSARLLVNSSLFPACELRFSGTGPYPDPV